MKQYEVTFIVDPVLSSDDIKATAKKYVDYLKENSCEIVHIEEMGLRQLTYPIKKRSTGIYFCVEFQAPNGTIINPMELNFRRDESILRFLSVYLDKFGVKYNADKRAGLIGKKREKKEKAADAPATKQNLQLIEGIGPKIEEILNDAGIMTYQQLGSKSTDKLKDILKTAGNRFAAFDPSTWSEQAVLASSGKMDELKILQDKLVGERDLAVASEEE